MDKNQKDFRDRLLHTEEVSDSPREKYEREIQAMLDQKLTRARKWQYRYAAIVGIGLGLLMAWAAWHLRAIPIERVDVARTQQASGTTDHEFQVDRYSRQLKVKMKSENGTGSVRMDFLDQDHQRLCSYSSSLGTYFTRFGMGSGFNPGRYILRVTESDATGHYQIDLFQRPKVPAPLGSAAFGILAAFLLLTGGFAVSVLIRGKEHARIHKPIAVYFNCIFAMVVIILLLGSWNTASDKDFLLLLLIGAVGLIVIPSSMGLVYLWIHDAQLASREKLLEIEYRLTELSEAVHAEKD